MIEIKNAFFEYPAREEGGAASPALRDVSLSVNKGDFIAVLGHNGSGKSTLARLINATLRPTQGTVFVDEIDASLESNTLAIRSKVGMVFQNPDNQIVASVVEEDVAFAPENLGIPSEEIRKRVDEALKTVGMYDYRTHAPHLLSGGQKQRVAIAGVLAMQPEYIVFDEPTAMLDPRGRDDVIAIIKKLQRDLGVTVVLITHHMDEALGCDRIIVMNDGVIALQGTPKEVFSKVELLRSLKLDVPETTALCYDLNREGAAIPAGILTIDDCVSAISELKLAAATDMNEKGRANPAPTDVYGKYRKLPDLIRAEHISHTYSSGTPFEKTALRDVTVGVKRGEYIGLIGHTGSGKSTLIQTLNALIEPTEGRVLLEAADINKTKLSKRDARFRVGLVFQFPEYQLFEETIRRDIAFGPRNMGLSNEEIDERVVMAAEFTGLSDADLDKSPFELSGGQRRRAAIAGVIAMKPEILILDEPTAGLDPYGCETLLNNIDEYRKKSGATVIIVTHSMAEVAERAERIVVMSEGCAVFDAPPRRVFENDRDLREMGLALPEAAIIANRLRQRGVELPMGIYTRSELSESINLMFSGRGEA